MFSEMIIPIILIMLVVSLALILKGFLKKSPQKMGGSKVSKTFTIGLKKTQITGGSHKRLYANKLYKKSTLPEVDYDLPSLYEKMKQYDPWSLWPQVFVDDWAF